MPIDDTLMRNITGFADGLQKLKEKQDQKQGAWLTPNEVSGMIWAIQQLRGRATDDPADPSHR